MRAAFALLVDRRTYNFMRKLAVEIHTTHQTGFGGALLPPHVSLKQPFEITDLAQVETYFDELAQSIAPIEITLTHLELAHFSYDDQEQGILWLDVQETPVLRELHTRINQELTERFGDTSAPFDGKKYHFHATVCIGGPPLAVYKEMFDTYKDTKVRSTFTAREMAMFYYDGFDDLESSSYITYKISELTGGG